MSAPAPVTVSEPPLPLLLPVAPTAPMSVAAQPLGCADARAAQLIIARRTAETRRRFVQIIV